MKKLAVAFFLFLSSVSAWASGTITCSNFAGLAEDGGIWKDEATAQSLARAAGSSSSRLYSCNGGYNGYGSVSASSGGTWTIFRYLDYGKECPSGQSLNSAGKCEAPKPPSCKSGETVDTATNKCVPECPLRQSKDSSGSCVADVPPVAGSEVPKNTSNGANGQVDFQDKTRGSGTPDKDGVTSRWGGGIGCVGGWEFSYAGGFCVVSTSDTLENCTSYGATYTGKTCDSEISSTPPGNSSTTIPGSTSGTACDAGYTQGSITLNGVTSITCTPTTNPGTGGNGSTGGNGTTGNCGGAGQSPCTVTISEPTSGVPGGLDASAFTSFEQAAAEHKGLFDQIAAGGNAGGLLSWAMLPEVPSYACVDPSGMFDGHVVGFSGWCEKAVLIRDFLAYVLWLGLLYAIFHIVTTSASGK